MDLYLLSCIFGIMSIIGVEGRSFYPRISNVYPTKKNFSFMAFVTTPPKSDPEAVTECGGTVVSTKWILTAAHCVVDGETADDVVESATVYLFSNIRYKGDTYEAKKIIPHEDFTMSDKEYKNDIALIKLTKTIDSPDYKPITVASKEYDSTILPAEILGWGPWAVGGTDGSDELRHGDVYINDCLVDIDSGKICAIIGDIFDRVVTVGFGDDGGPLYNEDDDSTFTQIGVISYASLDAGILYNFFTDVAYFSDWIDSTMNGN